MILKEFRGHESLGYLPVGDNDRRLTWYLDALINGWNRWYLASYPFMLVAPWGGTLLGIPLRLQDIGKEFYRKREEDPTGKANRYP